MIKISYSKKVFEKMNKDLTRLASDYGIFERNVNYRIAEEVLANISTTLANEKNAKHYLDSLQIVKISGTESIILLSNEMMVKQNIMDTDVDIIYFVHEKNKKLSSYDKYLIENSPFVSGFVTEISHNVIPVMRRVSKSERNEILDANLDIREILNTIKGKTKSSLFKIDNVYIDIYFMMMRLEFGLPGYNHNPHWSKIESHMKRIMKVPVKEEFDRFFSDKKFEDNTSGIKEIRNKDAQKINDFQANILG